MIKKKKKNEREMLLFCPKIETYVVIMHFQCIYIKILHYNVSDDHSNVIDFIKNWLTKQK